MDHLLITSELPESITVAGHSSYVIIRTLFISEPLCLAFVLEVTIILYCHDRRNKQNITYYTHLKCSNFNVNLIRLYYVSSIYHLRFSLSRLIFLRMFQESHFTIVPSFPTLHFFCLDNK